MKVTTGMRRFAIALSALALAGCGSDEPPAGQVVANVDGVEITQTELNAELGGRRAPTAEGQKQLQLAVLNQMIARVLLANAAKAQGLDKTPEAAVAKQRAEQLALIELLQKKLGAASPQVSTEEVSQFVADNSELFANRRIYVVDQIIVPSPPAPLLKGLEAVQTWDDAKAELAKYNLPANSAVGVVDALTVAPQFAKQVAALPANAVFIVPAQGAIRINHIRESQLSPVSGDDANRLAKEMLVQRRTGQQVQDAIGKILTEGRTKVKLNPAFEPPAAKAGAATGQAAKADG